MWHVNWICQFSVSWFYCMANVTLCLLMWNMLLWFEFLVIYRHYVTLFTLNYLPKSFDTGFVFDPQTARLALFLSPISSTLCLNSLWSISLICIELHCQSAGNVSALWHLAKSWGSVWIGCCCSSWHFFRFLWHEQNGWIGDLVTCFDCQRSLLLNPHYHRPIACTQN